VCQSIRVLPPYSPTAPQLDALIRKTPHAGSHTIHDASANSSVCLSVCRIASLACLPSAAVVSQTDTKTDGEGGCLFSRELRNESVSLRLRLGGLRTPPVYRPPSPAAPPSLWELRGSLLASHRRLRRPEVGGGNVGAAADDDGCLELVVGLVSVQHYHTAEEFWRPVNRADSVAVPHGRLLSGQLPQSVVAWGIVVLMDSLVRNHRRSRTHPMQHSVAN